ncbi:hypothetical protein NIES2119_05785 [[Phormidium ambiguum] IAM M-71]|uniref:Uncharacterized protein n=2 Tax=[Phormidium ambiguum] IAM M-71 TaxID=454136 RepID=A0A1U7IQP7_9CYAN|nr:hypothetical protein NIES2119_05785 [Phormidium ambiguum IAM M-71]
MNLKHQYLGVVEVGRFKLLMPDSMAGSYRRLTTMRMPEAQPPELDEIHLNEYEGQAILVNGYADEVWIWSAEVVEVAGSILTILVKQMLENIKLANPV